MYVKSIKTATLGITNDESDLFERVSKYLNDIISRMDENDLNTLSDNVGTTIGTLDDIKIANKIVKGIAMHMSIDNKGAKIR